MRVLFTILIAMAFAMVAFGETALDVNTETAVNKAIQEQAEPPVAEPEAPAEVAPSGCPMAKAAAAGEHKCTHAEGKGENKCTKAEGAEHKCQHMTEAEKKASCAEGKGEHKCTKAEGAKHKCQHMTEAEKKASCAEGEGKDKADSKKSSKKAAKACCSSSK